MPLTPETFLDASFANIQIYFTKIEVKAARSSAWRKSSHIAQKEDICLREDKTSQNLK